jgi:hypothetical protein
MKYQFDPIAESTPLATHTFNARQNQQAERARECNAERIFRWSYIPHESYLPKYVLSAIAEAGYSVVMIGSTTYQHSTFALYREVSL